MTIPRSALVSLAATSYYHCIGRCVRRAYLCGDDAVSGLSFEHRREWIVKRLAELSSTFALNLCAYAVMRKHYHLVLHIDSETADNWSDLEVLNRWCSLFSGPLIIQRYRKGEHLSDAELLMVADRVSLYRSRLSDLSWFMRCLNENIARMANGEDNCTGRFWEGRFKSRALLDEKALLSCMAYVDINPVRAGIAETPEQSNFTSIQQRIRQTSQFNAAEKTVETPLHLPNLMRFSPETDQLPFSLTNYMELLDWSGQITHPSKRAKIRLKRPSILQQLNIEPHHLIRYLNRKEQGFIYVIGTRQAIKATASKLGRKFLKGISAANRLFPITK